MSHIFLLFNQIEVQSGLTREFTRTHFFFLLESCCGGDFEKYIYY